MQGPSLNGGHGIKLCQRQKETKGAGATTTFEGETTDNQRKTGLRAVDEDAKEVTSHCVSPAMAQARETGRRRSTGLARSMTYREHPVRILDEAERRTRNRSIKFLKVQWSNHSEDEATWEREDRLRADYPSFFSE